MISDRGPLQTLTEKFEKGVFTPKMYQIFPVRSSPKKFENAITIGDLGFVFEKNLFEKNSFKK